jgi:hypothetical protein
LDAAVSAVEDLAAWLTAVWDEEEEAMRRVGERVWFVCDDGHVEEPRREDGPPFGSGEYERRDDGEYRLPNHHNTWLLALDPASVLARIAAYKELLALHSGDNDEACQSYAGNWIYEPCETLRLLASPYADRDGFRSEWLVERQGVEQ